MITKQLAELTKHMEKNQAAAIHTQPSSQEDLDTKEGVNWEEANYLGNSSRQANDPYSKTYNSGWRNHPNFGWGNQQSQGQDHRPHNTNQYNNSTHQNSNQKPYQTTQNTYSQLPYQSHNNHSQHPNFNQPSPLHDDRMAKMEAMIADLFKEIKDMKKFQEEVVSNWQNQDAATQKLEAQIGYLSKKAPGHSLGNATRTTSKEECKAITLRSGKELKETPRETQEEKEEGSSNAKEEAQIPVPNPSEEKEVLRPYVPKAPYPQRLMKNAKDSQFSKFLEIFKKLQINIPFAKALEQMPLYAKFLKELMTNKRSWRNDETVVLMEECSAIIQHKLSQKLKNPGIFQIPCIIGEITVEKALCDLEANRSFKFPHRIVEDLLVKVGDFIFPADFVVLDMEEEVKASIILGRPFLATAGAIIDVQKGELTLRLHDERMVFNVFKAMSYPPESLGECMRLDAVETVVQETFEEALERLTEGDSMLNIEVADVNSAKMSIPSTLEGRKKEKEAPKLELKALPPTLKYA
ncbi:uncharacterized protein [Arachis hypogaea]|uniref:uncharacterized protein n=1 Tax=Arachis hypogaea TaxID=3818 RepID=UPI000DEDF441|nr:uncharacterized protein LOC112777904 [Arachis hypogaea]